MSLSPVSSDVSCFCFTQTFECVREAIVSLIESVVNCIRTFFASLYSSSNQHPSREPSIDPNRIRIQTDTHRNPLVDAPEESARVLASLQETIGEPASTIEARINAIRDDILSYNDFVFSRCSLNDTERAITVVLNHLYESDVTRDLSYVLYGHDHPLGRAPLAEDRASASSSDSESSSVSTADADPAGIGSPASAERDHASPPLAGDPVPTPVAARADAITRGREDDAEPLPLEEPA